MNLVQLTDALAVRKAAGGFRKRRVTESPASPHVTVNGSALLQFGSNDYLGLANDTRVIAALRDGALRWGVGAGASHLVTGHTAAHQDLEDALGAFLECSALTFSSGYLANLAVLTALCNRESAIFSDQLNHACLIDGARLSRAEVVRFAHNDVGALERAMGASTAKSKLICVDGVFSMDGDLAPLNDYLRLAEIHDAWLLVDDAHAFGVLGDGRGSAAHFNLKSDRLITMGTLGKAAGVAGAFVGAQGSVIAWLVNAGRSYIYTTAAPPALACAALESLRIIQNEPQRRADLRARITQFRAGCAGLPWALMPSESPIQPLIVGSNEATLHLSAQLETRGLWVPAIRPPTVPEGTGRLRVSVSAAHTAAHVNTLLTALHAIAAT